MQELKDMYEDEVTSLIRKLRDTHDSLLNVIECGIAQKAENIELRHELEALRRSIKDVTPENPLLDESDRTPRVDDQGDLWYPAANGMWSLSKTGDGYLTLASINYLYGLKRFANQGDLTPRADEDALLNEWDHRPRTDADGDVWTRRSNGAWTLKHIPGQGGETLAEVHDAYGLKGFASREGETA